MTKKKRRSPGKSPVISIRLSPYKLAKFLDGMMPRFPSFEPKTLGKLVTAAFDIAINQVTYGATTIEPSVESMKIVENLINRRKKEKTAIEDITNELTQQMYNGTIKPIKKITNEEKLAKALEDADIIWKKRAEREQIKESLSDPTKESLSDPLTHDIDIGSKKSNVTDFSPLSMEDLDNLDNED